jgi:hypothetical protein
MAVTELTPDDADWAADLMVGRRREYEDYSPVFWRPAAHARAVHVRFLRRQIANPATVALRSPRGFLIAQLRPAEAFVDDFALDPAGTWAEDGAELLLAAWARVGTTDVTALRVVTARADEPKSALLWSLGLRLVEQWWVHELPAASSKATGHIAGAGVASGSPEPASHPADGGGPAAAPPEAAGPGPRFAPPERIEGPGFSGLFGPAPPVYDPGGPVLLADRVTAGADLAVLTAEATRRGAVLLVVPAPPGSAHARDLAGRGWAVASDWYFGLPSAAE